MRSARKLTAILISGLIFIMLAVVQTPAGADTVDVNIPGFSFSPAALTINVGQTVRWTNNHFVSHTSTSDNAVWDSGILTTGQSFSFTFTSPGVYPYHCAIHISMLGTITVNPLSCCVHPGDANHNIIVNIQDVTFLVNFLYRGGAQPVCQGGAGKYPEADANGNGITNIQDITYLINFLYKSGPAPICGPM